MRSSLGAELVAACIDGHFVMDVVEMQPPGGLIIRDYLGNTYTCLVYDKKEVVL